MGKIRESTLFNIKNNILDLNFYYSWGHIASSLSLVEILASLYFEILNFNDDSSLKDYLFLSKGHGASALYGVIIEKKIKDISYFYDKKTNLKVHSQRKKELGIPITTGSLGHALAIATGVSLGNTLLENFNHSYVIVGDGELQEGSILECAQIIKRLKINNITIIVDNNQKQASEEVDKGCNQHLIWKALGWNVSIIDGHNCLEITECIKSGINSSIPHIVFAKTIKGKGISFIEDNLYWHFRKLTGEEYNIAKKELEYTCF